MTRDGFFTGLDIGTNSIKVLVAEHRNGELNVIGVSNAKSKGVKDGIIVDIEAAATAIKSAISQAEEKAGISIKSVNVGLPGNLLQVEPTQGMIPVTSDTKEITDQDVENVGADHIADGKIILTFSGCHDGCDKFRQGCAECNNRKADQCFRQTEIGSDFRGTVHDKVAAVNDHDTSDDDKYNAFQWRKNFFHWIFSIFTAGL